MKPDRLHLPPFLSTTCQQQRSGWSSQCRPMLSIWDSHLNMTAEEDIKEGVP
jgi:hypothetical protein